MTSSSAAPSRSARAAVFASVAGWSFDLFDLFLLLYVAGRKGRKGIMVLVMSGVGVSTAAMGLVPTYAAVGVLAPVLFLTLRVVQGLFVGGVTATTHTIGTESIGPRHRGVMSGLIGAGGAGLGSALASVAYLVVNQIFPGAAFYSVGWRVLFFCGLLSAVLGLFVLRKVDESPAWREGAVRAKPVPFRALVRGNGKRVLALNIAVAAGGGAQYS
jgi:MHS family proline/betaine transporter-like MFS transporter